MTLRELAAGGGGLLVVILTLVQLAPVKLSPWSWLARALGRAFNGEVLRELEDVKRSQREAQRQLREHVLADDERHADYHRSNILRFNDELIRSMPHSRESFLEALHEIDEYERYCREHPDYRNNRAVHAAARIQRAYDGAEEALFQREEEQAWTGNGN